MNDRKDNTEDRLSGDIGWSYYGTLLRTIASNDHSKL